MPKLILALALASLACQSAPDKPAAAPATLPTAPVAVEPAPAPPALRLPGGVRPLRYAVDLSLDPDKESFDGVIDIDVELTAATRFLWLHATELTLASARAGDLDAQVVPGDADFVGLRLPSSLGPGPAHLRITYQGKAREQVVQGVFREKIEGAGYIFTQFEATDARRAFPCFDEPQFKVPWKLTLRVPASTRAYANTDGERTEEAGRAVYRFAETPPLPAYLVAFAVGPFDEVVARDTPGKVRVRIIVPHGQQAKAKHAAETVPALLDLMEAYFGTPYPYPKLDFLGFPSFPGAMENAGLITCNKEILLADEAHWTVVNRRTFASLAAHELAHQWFGDSVTLAWWDDTWLNEGFATWLAQKIVDQWKPEWEGGMAALEERGTAMASDSLTSARRIRQPIEKKDDIASAFDAITYSKSAAVLRMFESYIGEETFRAGVRRYIAKHAGGNATAKDFFAALSEGEARDVTAQISAYLDQTGVPLVTADLVCDAGKPPELRLAQTRYVPLGSNAPAEQLWPIPVCVRYPAGDRAERACTVLSARTGVLPLPASKTCPAWFSANADGGGYYHVRVSVARLRALLEKGATDADRVSALADAKAMIASGDLLAADALALIPASAASPNRHVVMEGRELLDAVRLDAMPEAILPHYASFIRKVYGERARALGWTAKPGETEETKLARVSLVQLVAVVGDDPALAAEALALARRWLVDRAAVAPELVRAVLQAAARVGDRALFDSYLAELDKSKESRDRVAILLALGAFRDKDLAARARQLALRPDLDLREAFAPLTVQSVDPRLKDDAYNWSKANIDALAAKLPGPFRGYLVAVAGAYCDPAHRREADTWWREKSKDWEGSARLLTQTLEAIDQCIAVRDKQGASLAGFLNKY